MLHKLRDFYYITHINNIPSILKHGILSHEEVENKNINFTRIYDEEIVETRRERQLPNNKTLWNYANLYFQPRNAMLYRVIIEKSPKDIAVISVSSRILSRKDIFITTGNAASQLSIVLDWKEGRKAVNQIRRTASKEYWTEEDGAKREMMAECLVPNVVPVEEIQSIYVADHYTATNLENQLRTRISIIPEPWIFFQPSRELSIINNLSLAQGDLFFSRKQTLTVSVNCVGVMGKGLASRAKYQFPDVYVFYQDLCRKKTLKMGKPYLFKREGSLDYKLADEPLTLTNGNAETWFLLFPTKNHWRENADYDGIERGLQWLQDNYKKEGIKSLAVPALGCGLGKLEWSEVGPLLCRYLHEFDIPVLVYLPAERRIPDDQLSKEFLLR